MYRNTFLAKSVDTRETILSNLRKDEPFFTYVESSPMGFWIYLNGEKLASFLASPMGDDVGLEFMIYVSTDLNTDDCGIIRFEEYRDVLDATRRLKPNYKPSYLEVLLRK